MRYQTGLLGSRQQSPSEFELDRAVPYAIGDEKVIVEKPTTAIVKNTVQGIFGTLPEEVRDILTHVAMDLIHNAQQHGRPSATLVSASVPKVALTLGWATDERECVKYPLIMVMDQNHVLPQVLEPTRTGIKRVIAQTHRCGAARVNVGKQVWALVDPQPRW